MKKFKSVLALAVAACFLMSMTACGKKEEEKKGKSDKKSEDKAADEAADEDAEENGAEGDDENVKGEKKGNKKNGSGDADDDSDGGSGAAGNGSGSGSAGGKTAAGGVKVGDTITFGKYEQDNDTSNGAEDIEWIVLETNDQGDALLLSVDALDGRAYHKVWAIEMTWEACSLRQWLNDDFVKSAFRDEELEKIIVTDVENPDNKENGTEGGNNTKDLVFLLSIDEAEKYFDSDEARICHPSAAAWAGGLEAGEHTIMEGNCRWWLRTPGDSSSDASRVFEDGSINAAGGSIDRELSNGVRPAMWVNLDGAGDRGADDEFWSQGETVFTDVTVLSMIEAWTNAGITAVPVKAEDIGADKYDYVEGAYGEKDGQIYQYVYIFRDKEAALNFVETVVIPNCEGYSLLEMYGNYELWVDNLYAGSIMYDGSMLLTPCTTVDHPNTASRSDFSDAGVQAVFDEYAAKGFAIEAGHDNAIDGFNAWGNDENKMHIEVFCRKYASQEEALEKLQQTYESMYFDTFEVENLGDGTKAVTIDAPDNIYYMGPITGTVDADGLFVAWHPYF